MEKVEEIKEILISKILTINNTNFLVALDNLITSSGNFNSSDIYEINNEQKKMLEMSEDDINNGRIISQESILKRNTEWLNAI